MSRRLTTEERTIWRRLTETVRRRDGVQEFAPPEPTTEPSPPPRSEPLKGVTRPQAPAILPQQTLDTRLRRRLSRGLIEVDARLDLHGMTQERAHSALLAFLKHSRVRGHKVVLVITGKGSGEGTGILREAVPHWLARHDFRALVSGFEPASRRHGGEGALYIRLRRRAADQLA